MGEAPDTSDPIPFEDARSRVISRSRVLDPEPTSASDAGGRILARDLVAPWPLPPHDQAALDGFAIQADATTAATQLQPVVLAVDGRILAGDPITAALSSATVVEIATGARIPPFTDTLVPYENVVRAGDSIQLGHPVVRGANIRRRGEDMGAGDRIARAGDRVDPGLIGLLAAYGLEHIEVPRRPRVSLISTGNELRPVEQAEADQVTDTNAPVIAALARRAGAEVRTLGIAPDDVASLRERIFDALSDADLVVTIGGASVGPRDLVHEVLVGLDAEVVFRGIAIKPGKPCALYGVGGRLILSVPGNPAAAALTFELLGGSALIAMQGGRYPRPPYPRAMTTEPLATHPRKTTLLRGLAFAENGRLRFKPTPHRGSANLRVAVGSNVIAILDPQAVPLPAGAEISLWPGDGLVLAGSPGA